MTTFRCGSIILSRNEARRILSTSAKLARCYSPSNSTVSKTHPLTDIPTSQFLSCRALSSAPFYGNPLPPSSRYNSSSQTEQGHQHYQHHHLPTLTPFQRLATLLHSSITAINDPTRADAVAAVGEVTGSYALSKLMRQMENDEVGRRILKERPVVNHIVAERAFQLLHLERNQFTHNQTQNNNNDNDNNNSTSTNNTKYQPKTFGAAYATFLQNHNFHPNERDPIRFLPDPHLAYVMTRYRQNHDYWHALTNLPPTVLGELALKWLELLQTGLPLAALSATVGSFASSNIMMSARDKEVLWEVYFPWAMRVGGQMKDSTLMCVYYEEELETDLSVLRERMGIEAAPCVEL